MGLLLQRFLAPVLLFFLFACAPLIGPFSEQAYQNATSLKARSLALVAQSTSPVAAHAADLEALMVDVDAAYEYVAGRAGNEVARDQWATLRNPETGPLGRFAAEWRRKGALNPFLRGEYQRQVSQGFDTLICVEANKQANVNCTTALGG